MLIKKSLRPLVWSSAYPLQARGPGKAAWGSPQQSRGRNWGLLSHTPALLPHCIHLGQRLYCRSFLFSHSISSHYPHSPWTPAMTWADSFPASTTLRSPLVAYNVILFPSLSGSFDKTFYTFANSDPKYEDQRTEVGTTTLELNVNTPLHISDVLGC